MRRSQRISKKYTFTETAPSNRNFVDSKKYILAVENSGNAAKDNLLYLNNTAKKNVNCNITTPQTNIKPTEASNKFEEEGSGGTQIFPKTEKNLISDREQNHFNANLCTKNYEFCEIIDLTDSPPSEKVRRRMKTTRNKSENKRTMPENHKKRRKVTTNSSCKTKKVIKAEKMYMPLDIESQPKSNLYHNPVKDFHIPPLLRVQPLTSGGPYFDNAIDPRLLNLNTVQQSYLPQIYPPHFSQQLLPETVAHLSSQIKNVRPHQPIISQYANYPTPDHTQSFNFLSPSTLSSLTDSELMDSDNIREILNIAKTSYPLSTQHLQTLALVLNLNFDYLLNLIEKILKLGPDLLQKINVAFYASETQNKSEYNNDVKPFSNLPISDELSAVNPSQSPRI